METVVSTTAATAPTTDDLDASEALADDAGAASPAATPAASPEAEQFDDARVSAVLAVLRGAPVDSTAARWSLDPTLLQRWVTSFVGAGTAAVVNRVDAPAALSRRRLLGAMATEVAEPLVQARESMRRLRERTDDPAAVSTHTADLDDALERLDRRVSDAHLLFAAALGGVGVERRRISLRDLATGLGPVGSLHGKDPAFEVDVDPELFARVVRDLWTAAGTQPRPASRRIYVRVVGPWVEFRVLRVGDPIDIEVLQTMFEPFDHDPTNPVAISGVTTGLYLARALTVAHGGSLGVDQDDARSAFWVRIPSRSATVSSTALTRRRRPPMPLFKLACGDVMPGCSARFEDSSRDGLFGQVAQHAAHDHGITDITPEIRAAVESKIIAA